MRRFAIPVVLILCAVMMVSCGKRYVGEPVGFAGDGWCHYSENIDNGVQRCIINHDWVEIDFQIRKAEKPGEYLIEGTLDLSKGGAKSFDKIDEAKSRFFMLVASGGVVVDNVSFRPVNTGNFGSKLPFKFKYRREDGFGMITFGYQLFVIG